MSKEEFKPNESHKQVSDLPESQRGNFVDLPEGGFVRQEAVDNLAGAQEEADFRNQNQSGEKEEALGILKEEAWDRKRLMSAIRMSRYPRVFLGPRNFGSDDKEIVMSVVSRDGAGLEGASDILKNDRDVVLAAVKSSPFALQYASPELRSDREIVLEALKQDMGGIALKYTSDNLRADPEVVWAAVETYGPAIQYAAESLIANKEFIVKVFSQQHPYMHNLDGAIYGEPSPFLKRINEMHDLHITWHYD